MQRSRKAAPTIGCFVIEDLSSGGHGLSGICDFLNTQAINICTFERHEGGDLHTDLQKAFYAARADSDVACIMATGSGVDAAIALCVQLPVDRIVLFDDDGSRGQRTHAGRQVGKISRFARRNGALCLADVLIVCRENEGLSARMKKTAARLVNSRVYIMSVYGMANKKTCTNGEQMGEKQIYRFLCTGELSKSLAENHEMCIIYE